MESYFDELEEIVQGIAPELIRAFKIAEKKRTLEEDSPGVRLVNAIAPVTSSGS